MPLVELARFQNQNQAELARLKLVSEGIDALVFDQGLSSAFGGALAVRLMVLDEDREAAETILGDELPG